MISRLFSSGLRQFLGGKAAVPVRPEASPTARAGTNARPAGHRLIAETSQLAPLLAALDRVDEVFLDTEADNMFCYRTRVCLLQFLVDGEVFLVDLMVPLRLEPLWERLAKKHLVMHGSDFDLRLLHDLCGFRAHSLFDTNLAAQLLNRPRTGLAALLEDNFGVTLDKSSQRANWSRRPLTQKLLDYAALDVWYLPALRDLLAKELVGLDRLGWLEQQCRRQIEAALAGFPRDDENAWRIGRSERLRGAGLGVLHAVWHWREDWARKLDSPPFKVCGNDLLLKFAFAAEEGGAPDAILNGAHLGKRHERLAPSLVAAVAAGLALDPRTLPRRPRVERHSFSASEIARQDLLKAGRDRIAAQLKMDPSLIANRSQLAELARSPDRIDEILLPWQADLLRADPALKSG
jgi:ribonuclease D